MRGARGRAHGGNAGPALRDSRGPRGAAAREVPAHPRGGASPEPSGPDGPARTQEEPEGR